MIQTIYRYCSPRSTILHWQKSPIKYSKLIVLLISTVADVFVSLVSFAHQSLNAIIVLFSPDS